MATKPKNYQKQIYNKTRHQKASGYTTDIQPDILFQELFSGPTSDASTKTPTAGLDDEVKAIFAQAGKHRDQLIRFFILYTSIFSGAVAFVVVLQAIVRVIPGRENVELIPQWALSLLLAGMFGQFIALLTIVTKKAWSFETFFRQASAQHPDIDNDSTNY